MHTYPDVLGGTVHLSTERDPSIFPTGDHNPSRDHSPKLFIPTYDRSLWFFQYRPQVRTSIRILILVHNISNMNIQDCRDLVSKFVSSTFDGWPLPRRCGPRFVIPISKTFIDLSKHLRIWGRQRLRYRRPAGPGYGCAYLGAVLKNQSNLS